MQTSNYLRQALFHQLNHGTDQFLETKSEVLFQRPGGKSFIEVQHQQQPGQQGLLNNALILHDEQTFDWTFVTSSTLNESRCSSLHKDPQPIYDNSPGLIRYDVRDLKDLQHIESATRHYFRVCFIHQVNSMSRLLVTRELFDTFMAQFQVLPQFWEYVLLFGAKFGENEMSPPHLRFRWLAEVKAQMPTGCLAGFECAYGLRYAELNGREGDSPWSIRQTAIYHKYTTADKSSSWIMIAASERTQSSLNFYAKSCTDLGSFNPFEIHVLVLDSALANWRSYITNLTERITRQSDKVLVASIDGKDPSQLIDVEERQQLKEIEDQILDVILVLDSTSDTIVSLIENYRQFCQNPSVCVWKEPGDGNTDAINVAFQEKQRDVCSSKMKVQTLHAKLKSTIELLSSLLELGNGESLRQLAEESRQENFATRSLTEKSTQDGAAVKVLTTITLIYLPTTVVSNFFSTQFVTQKQDGNSTNLALLSNTWLFAAICIPLTILTLILWWAWVRCQVRPARSTAEPTVLQKLKASGFEMRRFGAGIRNTLTEPHHAA